LVVVVAVVEDMLIVRMQVVVAGNDRKDSLR